MEKPSEVSPEDNRRTVTFGWQRSTWILYISSTLTVLWIVIPYVIAVSRGEVKPFLPYISQAAGTPPQTGIFTFVGALVAILACVVAFLRFAVIYCNSEKRLTWNTFLNYASLLLSLIGASGLLLAVGYPIWFKEGENSWYSNVAVPHVTGAVLLIVMMQIYMFSQCILTYLNERCRGKRILVIRCSICIVYLVASFLSVSVIRKAIPDMNNRTDTIRIPKEFNEYYLISSICEWLFPLLLIAFIMTYMSDFRELSVGLCIKCKSLTSTSNGQPLTPTEAEI